MRIKVSEYIANQLAEAGIEHVFMITGGGAMHLDDAIGKHPRLRYICNHHEQASAMAAESYARLSGRMAALCVTTGPGGTNAITGVYGGYVDSIPMIVISGQVRYDTTIAGSGLALRQMGDQEINIVDVVKGITKYAVMVTDPNDIGYHLGRALHLAQAGRAGPCWIDVPMNVQGAQVDPDMMRRYDPKEDEKETPPRVDGMTARKIIEKLRSAKRPVLLAGSAIRLSGAHADFLKLVDLLNIPVVTAWNAHDNISDDHPLYFGRPGSVGDRAGNFIVQNSDVLVVLGCRLNIRQLSYDWNNFAREAFKIIVDVDPLELRKPTMKPDLPVRADVRDLIRAIAEEMKGEALPGKNDWLDWCRIRKEKYPVVLNEYWSKDSPINPYCFMETLSEQLGEGQITVTGNGTACVCSFQAMKMKEKQRLYTNSGCAAMGYDIPAAIGACFASGKQKIVCLAGDGSLQLNIQELQTIVHHHLPIKIFVLNNNGYVSIRQTQENFFGLPLVGCDPKSGVTFPDMERIAAAYGIPFGRCPRLSELHAAISANLRGDGPSICEVMLDPEQPFAPKSSSRRLSDGRIVSRPLEDLAPFLEREEYLSNMIVRPIEEEIVNKGG